MKTIIYNNDTDMELVIKDMDSDRTIRIPFENLPLLIAAMPGLEERFASNGEEDDGSETTRL